MTIDERLEALTRNLELLSLESEKHDRLDSHDERLDKLE
jgi:hypothetical protein